MNDSDLTIRKAEIGDSAAISLLSEQLGYPCKKSEIEKRLLVMDEKGHAVFVANLDSFGVVGWIHLMPRRLLYLPVNAEIGGLVVHREQRLKGIGRALISFAECWAREKGYANIVVRSDKAREESHVFYRAIGYSIIKAQNVYLKEMTGQQINPAENQGGRQRQADISHRPGFY